MITSIVMFFLGAMSAVKLRLYRLLLQKARHFDHNPAMKAILRDLNHFEPLQLRTLLTPSMNTSLANIVKTSANASVCRMFKYIPYPLYLAGPGGTPGPRTAIQEGGTGLWHKRTFALCWPDRTGPDRPIRGGDTNSGGGHVNSICFIKLARDPS